MGIISKIKDISKYSIIKSAYFNFHYLPFKQAIKLPILLRKPKFLTLKGRVIIDADQIKTGMIRMGSYGCCLFPDKGILFENHGGTIIFRGRAGIGNSSSISIGRTGRLDIGENFHLTAQLRLTCYHKITFDPWVCFGWDCLVMDTDLHTLQKVKGGHSRGYGEIHLGHGVWCGTKCMIMKGTVLPAHTTVTAGTKLGKRYDIPEYCVIGSSTEIAVIAEGLYFDSEHKNDQIEYPEVE